MVVLSIDSAPPALRGELTKWLIEPKPNVFVGKISALVRTKLWNMIEESEPKLDALMIFSSNNEQGFSVLMTGDPHRKIVDLDGVQLIEIH